MFKKLKSLFKSRTPPTSKKVTARFDAAQTTRDNHKHWAGVDYLSADLEAAPEVRRTLRMSRCQDGEAFAVLPTNPFSKIV